MHREIQVLANWAPNYQDLGRPDLDGAGLRQRLTEWMLKIPTPIPTGE